MNFQLDFDPEMKKILGDFLRELRILNEHLLDFKIMVAPCLGFKVKDKEEET